MSETVDHYGPNVRIRSTYTGDEGAEIVEELLDEQWVQKGRFGHMRDDFAMTNARNLARGLATKYIGGH